MARAVVIPGVNRIAEQEHQNNEARRQHHRDGNNEDPSR